MNRAAASWGWLWIAWTAVILLVGVLPLRNFVGHPHWASTRWLPSLELVDTAANVLLFVPFGLLQIARSRRPHRLRPLLLALVLSAAIELYQVYCHDRHPSLVDLASNVLGAALGSWIGGRVFRPASA